MPDGRTDRQNYDSQDRSSIAASRGKNGKSHKKSLQGGQWAHRWPGPSSNIEGS